MRILQGPLTTFTTSLLWIATQNGLRSNNAKDQLPTARSHFYTSYSSFGVVDCVVTDNATQFISSEFRDFCKTYQVDNITTPQYHPRSNGQPDRFVDTLKWVLKKAQGTPTDRGLQQFLHVYRITPNPNIPMGRRNNFLKKNQVRLR